ncbi:MAG: hypothetical protein LT102_15550 [Burkholderiaceae bacterium]|nr:hypothetical protein [Burkholderiaceae bacterium]
MACSLNRLPYNRLRPPPIPAITGHTLAAGKRLRRDKHIDDLAARLVAARGRIEEVFHQ